MRIFGLAIGIIFGFGLGVWAIAKLVGDTAPEWVGVTLSMAWLFLLVFVAALMSGGKRRRREDQRRLLGYGLLATVLVASFLMPIFVYDIKLPRWLAQAIVFAIAGAVFLFSKFMERRNLRRSGDNE